MFLVFSYAFSMECPHCRSKTKVTNSRKRARGTQTWRRRECKSCGNIWTTHEVIDLSTSYIVEGAQGHRQPFSRDKLFMSIQESLRHRKTALADATALTDTVLARILAQKTATIPEGDLFAVIYEVIKKFDRTAAAVYKATYR